VHKVITQRCPSYVADLVAFCASDTRRRSLRSTSTYAAITRRTRTELGRQSCAPCMATSRAFQLSCYFNVLLVYLLWMLLFLVPVGLSSIRESCLLIAWITDSCSAFSDFIPVFTALHGMQTALAMRILSVRPYVCPYVCLSVTRVNCDKTVERSVQIYIPYERSFSLVFWEKEWLVGCDPLCLNFGSTGPRWSKIADFEPIFAHSASAVTHSEKKFNQR